MKIQPRLKHPRRVIKSYPAKEIEAAVRRDVMRWNCSRSWIIATALAAFYNIDIITPYEVKKKKRIA